MRLKPLLIILIGVVLVVLIALVGVLVLNLNEIKSPIEFFPAIVPSNEQGQPDLSLYDFTKQTPSPLEQEPTPVSNLKQTAWIPDWDFYNGFSSFTNNLDYFDSVSPVWYYLTDDGDINRNMVGYNQIRQVTKNNGIELIPSIANFNADQFHIILDDDQELESHINYLISEVMDNDFDGIDLDYESIYLNDQPEFLYLVRKLSEALHEKNKELTIAVMPNWTDSDIFRGLRQTRQVQDWYEISEYVDELRIMTYNLTDYMSTYPGPIGPLDWLEANLRYAFPRIPMDKVMLGINMYGYSGWSDNPTKLPSYLGAFSNPYADSGQADAVTYGRVAGVSSSVLSDEVDPSSKEKVLRFSENGSQYIMYYQDVNSAKYRYDLAREYGIGGVAHWRMGDEDERIYKLID